MGGLILFDYFGTRHKFPPHSFIGNIDVSLLSNEQAIEKLAHSDTSEVFPFSIIFSISSTENISISPKEFGAYVLLNETVNNALSLIENINYITNLQKRLVQKPQIFSAKLSFDENQAKEVLLEIAQQINSNAVDAKIEIDETTGGYHIYPDKPQKRVNIDKTFSNLKTVLEKGENIVPLVIDFSYDQKIKEFDLRSFPPVYRLSAYTTYYGTHDSPNRIHNIKLIASWLNNTLIMPNETLSLVEKVGDFTPERGFKEAFVIANGELVPQLGGGTCQIGTTLYNAVALADLNVLSRRNHSFYFNIYPLGRDATVYPGSSDFKFQNDTKHPILIKAVATNKKLSFRIYGTPTNKQVEFSNPAIYLLNADGVFHPATLRQVIANDAPFRTIVKRTVKDQNGTTIKEETIRSYYKLYGEKTNVPIRRPEPR